ncbi:MAG: putative rane protein, partial [Frankiales bacterium]|nr:putative rane protein [Frankiales bacterium]
MTRPDRDDEDTGWQRLHPLTPVLRGGRSLAVLVGVLGTQGLRQGSPLGVAGVLGAGALLAALAGTVAWRTTRYRVEAGELQVDSGVLVRRARRVPLARMQSVDVVRPLAARVLGLAELRLEVVGGDDTEAPLRYLSEADARRLQEVLLAGGRRTTAQDPAHDPAHGPVHVAEQVLVQVPTGALVGSVLLGGPAIVSLLVLVALLVVLAVQPSAALPLLGTGASVVLATGGVSVRRVLAEYGATVAESPEGLRLRSGLLDTRTQAVPPGRVQAVRVLEPLLWRPFGW